MRKFLRSTATVIIAVSILLLLAGCANGKQPTPTDDSMLAPDRENEAPANEQPIPTDEAVLAEAEEHEVPSIELLGLEWFEGTMYGNRFPEFDIRISNGTLIAWYLNGRYFLWMPRRDSTNENQSGSEIIYRTNQLRLIEGENELIIRARGPTGLIVERRLVITSNQTTPEDQGTAMPRLNDVTISYDPEYPTIVIVAFEFSGDYYGEALRVSAVANHPSWDGTQEDVVVTDKGGGVFEVTVEMFEYSGIPGHFSRKVRITLENERNISSWGEVYIATGDGTERPGIREIACINRGGWMMEGGPYW